ncbi:putative bifunctional diguanylate cyclase/phosphodiesterase [Salipiger mangrovisoli]|uniref:Bifunctional diguanylate cyclase/phosphodiesterase n=1 Tax=Salipiger mangrovisoli TaxID=2865933 RepID=A0ABR9WW55_9RHOB|nr:bifunctional diguanylate cyclase/phosphodiesterase [Salipiger mangrovisoli]MBE9635528.1 bifunctional diguanylate cyclase/phosphodiesterase [Salipiger mangrovisoli]
MSDLPDLDAFGRNGVPVSELDELLDRIGAASLPLSGAVACLVDLAPEVVGPRGVRMVAPLHGPLSEALQCLIAHRKQMAPCGARSQVVSRAVAGRSYRFLIESIGPDTGSDTRPDAGSDMGTVILGYEADTKTAHDMERRARPFLDLLEALLIERCTKLAVVRDMAALELDAAEFREQAQKDALTGLINACTFRERARQTLAEAHGPHALVLLDVDHFKQINDLHGHQFGDVYLSAIAGVLRGSFGPDTLIGRMGGDEFALLLPEDADGALVRATEACRKALARLGVTMGKPELGSVSMGAAFFPRHGESYDALFELADTALYAAKENGRGSVVSFDPHRHLRFSLRELMRDFSEALAEGEIRPVFHPVVDLATGHCSGYEVLARWRGASGETLGPERFSPIFENGVLAEQLTRSMITQASHLLRSLPQRTAAGGAPLRIGINVTGFDLLNSDFAGDLGDLLSELRLPWSAIVIEVPETVMLGETGGRAFETLRELRGRGARIALDDFGTGYGSLRHLEDWPVDMLKIDRQFVQGLSARPRDRAVVEAILGIARRFGFRVVAEGIETPGQLSYLMAMGCDAGQGHLLSPPLEAHELATAPAVYRLRDRVADED